MAINGQSWILWFMLWVMKKVLGILMSSIFYLNILCQSSWCLIFVCAVLHLTLEHDLFGLDSWLALELFPAVSDLWCFLSLFPSPWFTKSNCSSYVCRRFIFIWLKLPVHIIDCSVGRDCWRLKRFNLSLDNYSEPICGVEEANLNLFDDGVDKHKFELLFLKPSVYA